MRSRPSSRRTRFFPCAYLLWLAWAQIAFAVAPTLVAQTSLEPLDPPAPPLIVPHVAAIVPAARAFAAAPRLSEPTSDPFSQVTSAASLENVEGAISSSGAPTGTPALSTERLQQALSWLEAGRQALAAGRPEQAAAFFQDASDCLLYTSDAADE